MSYPRTRKPAKPAKRKSVKVKIGYCWVARETRKGWQVRLDVQVNDGDWTKHPIKGLLFKDPNTIHWLGNGQPGIVYVHMKHSAWTFDKKSGKMTRLVQERTKKG